MTTSLPCAFQVRSSSGVSARHGEHHDAQMLTITAFPRRPTSTPSKASADIAVSSPAIGRGRGVPDASKGVSFEGRVTAYTTRSASTATAISFVRARGPEGAVETVAVVGSTVRRVVLQRVEQLQPGQSAVTRLARSCI